MSCARGYTARKEKEKERERQKERKEIGEILWIYGEGKDRTVKEMDPYDKLKSKFPARYGSELLPPQGVLTMDTG